MRSQNAGNVLTEYGLVLALVAAVAIGGVSLLGQQTFGLIGNTANMQADRYVAMDFGVSEGQSAAPANPPTPTPSNVTTIPPLPEGKDFTLVLSNGTQVQLRNFPMNLEKSVSTVGSNGTTEVLMANLKAVTQQLLDQGEITQEEADILTGLANKGHEIAARQRRVEDILKSRPQWSISEYNAALESEYPDWSDSLQQGNGEFKETYDQVTELMAARNYDPAVQKLVKTIGEDIQYMGTWMHSNTYGYTHSRWEDFTPQKSLDHLAMALTPDSIHRKALGFSKRDVNSLPISGMTDAGSAIICESGTGTDSGRVCH